MNMEFFYQIHDNGNASATLELKGYFDEFAKLPEDTELAKFNKITVDFGEVGFINSGGIKIWINFLEKSNLVERAHFSFTRCPRIIVDQINMIDGFFPKGGKVISVYVPLYCEECDKNYDILLEMDKFDTDFDDLVNRVPQQTSEQGRKCRNWEVDIVPKRYFRFRSF
jgi:Zn finger protein HypA/HybF involved in hydrogenase expression